VTGADVQMLIDAAVRKERERCARIAETFAAEEASAVAVQIATRIRMGVEAGS
jgi:hypothetical protein